MPKTPLTSGLGLLDSPLLKGNIDAVQRKRAELEATDGQARGRIRSLDQSQQAALATGIEEASSLLGAWRDGAVSGVTSFKSKLVSDESSMAPALAGNLLWAATAIEAVPAKVLLSFVGATLGTLGSIPPEYDAVIGPITGDATKRVNDLHDDILNRMDVLVFPILHRMGFPTFAALERPRQLAHLWAALFKVPSTDGRYIEPTKAFVLSNLQLADQDAFDRLQLFARAWNASLRISGGSDIEGVLWEFDGDAWAQYVTEPVWLWTGGVSPSIMVIRGEGDPAPSVHDRRAAAMLRLAIERRWPNPIP